jgi:hypothetical protein
MGASGSAEVAVRFGAARASAVHIAEVIAEVKREHSERRNALCRTLWMHTIWNDENIFRDACTTSFVNEEER